MPLQLHSLKREFPQYEAQMSALLKADGRFTRQAEEYERLDKQIFAVEDGREAMDDSALLSLKMHRVTLKDELLQTLEKQAQA